MKVAFYGSTIFSLEILKKLLELQKSTLRQAQGDRIELAYVVSQPAKPFGRKQELKDNVVAEFCRQNSITLFTPNKLKELKEDSEFIIRNSELALALVAAYGKILPSWLLETSKHGFINFHGSLLPKYRGAVPVQMCVMNQDVENSGVTIQKMELEMDEGAMLAQLKVQSSEFKDQKSELKVGLEHPSNFSKVIGVVNLKSGFSICGSSKNRRSWKNESHIVNLDHEKYTEKILSTWVVSNTATISDSAATCLFMCEPEHLKKSFPEIEFLILYEDFKVVGSGGFEVELF